MSIALEDLYARLGLRVDRSSFAAGRQEVGRTRDELGRFVAGAKKGEGAVSMIAEGLKMAFGLDLYAGIKRAGAAVAGLFVDGVRYNASLEESTSKIAGMLALSAGTKFSDEIGTANQLMKELSERAAKLPGTTAEYVAMLGDITQPVRAAGASVQELNDLTVGAVVAAKALGEQADVAARDIGQALRGQAGADDPFIGKLLATEGFVGEGRKRFNTSSQQERLAIVRRLLTSSQLRDMAEAQGASMGGLVSTAQDSVQRFFGASTKGIFDGIKSTLAAINAWTERNAEKIAAVASAISRGLSAAFRGAVAVVRWARDMIGEAVDAVRGLLDKLSNSSGMRAVAQSLVEALRGVWGLLAPIGRVVGAVFGVAWKLASGLVRVGARLLDVLLSVFQRMGLFRDAASSTRSAFDGVAAVLNTIVDALEWVGDAVEAVTEGLLWLVDELGTAFHAVFDPILDGVDWLLKSVDKAGRLLSFDPTFGRVTPKQSGFNPTAIGSAVTAAQNLDPWGTASGPVTTTTYAPTINVTAATSASADEIAQAIDRTWVKKMRQAAAARPR